MSPQRTYRKKKNRNTPIIALACVLAGILVVLVMVAFILSKEPAPQPQNPQPSTPATQATQPPEPTQPLLQGWQDQVYYENGLPKTGLFTVDGKTYLADAQGQLMAPGWQEFDDARYYLDSNSVVLTGWQTVDGQAYYFRENGKMARGTVEIDGVKWHFSSAGISFVMVNPWHSLPEGYNPELVTLPEYYGANMRVDKSCYESLLKMIDDCNAAMNEQYKNSGEKIPRAYVISSYRTMEDQTNAYWNKVDRVMAANPGMSREEAEKEAAKVVAYPGTSEHQLGLAVDIIDTRLWALEEEQENLPAQKWLMENCWRYGFVLRYLKGQTDSTGIIYEPWHYRYLGEALAAEIYASGMTVEQYLQSLS